MPDSSTRSFVSKLGGALLWGGPILLWGIALFYGGAEGARYETSWRWIQTVLRLLCPEHAPPGDPDVVQVDVSMYQINGALRRIAHIVGYAVLSALVVRFFQRGEKRLKRSSLIAAVILGILYMGADELHRLIQPNRHAKWLDLFLNLGGVALTLLLTVLYFGWKSWERRFSTPPGT